MTKILRCVASTLFTLLFLQSPAHAAEVFLFQGFDHPDRYQKLPAKTEKPVLMVYIPRACPTCWNEWRSFYAAFARWEKMYDVWFIGDFPLWSHGRDLFRQRAFPAKVSNQAYFDPGRRFGKSILANEKRPTLVLLSDGKFRNRDVLNDKQWASKVGEILGGRR